MLPGVIDDDYTGPIGIIVKVFCPPVTILQGSVIAQLTLFLNQVPKAHPAVRGEKGFGSTGQPLVAFSEVITSGRLERSVTITGPYDKTLMNKKMLLDTGSDITIIPWHEWPPDWPLETTNSSVLGIGGSSPTQRSMAFITIIDGKEDLTAHVQPYILNTVLRLLRRDVLSQWGCKLTTPF